jgi:hypothetical protein
LELFTELKKSVYNNISVGLQEGLIIALVSQFDAKRDWIFAEETVATAEDS